MLAQLPITEAQRRRDYDEAGARIISRAVQAKVATMIQGDDVNQDHVMAHLCVLYGINTSTIEHQLGRPPYRVTRRRAVPMSAEFAYLVPEIQRTIYTRMVEAAGNTRIDAPGMVTQQGARALERLGLDASVRHDIEDMLGNVITNKPARDFSHVRGLHYYATQPQVREEVNLVLSRGNMNDARARLERQIAMANW